MIAQNRQVRREEWREAPMEYADVGLTGKFKLATMVAALNAAIILFAFRLKVRISNGPWTFCFSLPLLRRLDLVYLRLP